LKKKSPEEKVPLAGNVYDKGKMHQKILETIKCSLSKSTLSNYVTVG
jgi:hypothetical protein